LLIDIMPSRQTGAVALEFLLLFPLVISLIYAAGVYGVLFSWQVRMQVAVDRSTAAVMALDRSSTSAPATKAAQLANTALGNVSLSFLSVPPDACKSEDADGNGEDDTIACSLSVVLEDGGCGDETSTAGGPKKLGFFGGFPPLPDCLTAEAKVAF
tara:strand:- start:660 stop:1127 length:468 start_codon:yes stop_codon:yes gene_type:complete